MSQYEARFGGIGRLFSAAGLARLRDSHVAVIGVGGVGSWTVEALARSGIGELTLVDLDEICVTNVNRQLHALDGAIGAFKVEAMAGRVAAINPECVVHSIPGFFTEASAAEILSTPFSFVVDAIDRSPKKALLIARCRELHLPLVTVGAAGGRRDPTAVRVADLARAGHDRLLRETRNQLRSDHGFAKGDQLMGVSCVFSTESVRKPSADELACAAGDGPAGLRIDCNSGYGTASFVTGTFGLVAAGEVVRQLAEPY